MSLLDRLRALFDPPQQPEPEQPLDIPEALAPHRRSCWVPITYEPSSPDAASFFGSAAFLPAGTSPPACGECGRAMPTFLQISSADLPAAVGLPFGSGILQLFCCTTCDAAYEPFSNAAHVRVLPLEIAFCGLDDESEPATEEFPAFVISGWTEHDDYPNPDEQLTAGIALPDDVEERVAQAFPVQGDKLLGWPHWVQGVEYPSCTVCHARMRYVFQIDSEDNLPWMFGDVGCGHLFVCETHEHVLSFHWACC